MAQGKSPFELRADLLKLAFEILLAEHSAKAAAEDKTALVPLIITAPTSEEIIEEARKLNDFISKSGSDRRDK